MKKLCKKIFESVFTVTVVMLSGCSNAWNDGYKYIAHNKHQSSVLTVTETKAGVKPADIRGTQKLPQFAADIPVILYLSQRSINTEGYLIDWEVSDAESFQWYTGSKDNWEKVSSEGTDSILKIQIKPGIRKYVLEAKSKDGKSVAYSNVCTIICGGDQTDNIGKIAYSDGTYSDDFESGKTAIGIVFDVKNDGTPKSILNLDQVSSKMWCSDSVNGFTKNFVKDVTTPLSYSDGSKNWQIICENEEIENIEGNYYAFEYCNSIKDGAKEWYLPSRDELLKIYFNKNAINAAIKKLNDNCVAALELQNTISLWSSSQTATDDFGAWGISFDVGWNYDFCKDYDNAVRAVARL